MATPDSNDLSATFPRLVRWLTPNSFPRARHAADPLTSLYFERLDRLNHRRNKLLGEARTILVAPFLLACAAMLGLLPTTLLLGLLADDAEAIDHAVIRMTVLLVCGVIVFVSAGGSASVLETIAILKARAHHHWSMRFPVVFPEPTEFMKHLSECRLSERQRKGYPLAIRELDDAIRDVRAALSKKITVPSFEVRVDTREETESYAQLVGSTRVAIVVSQKLLRDLGSDCLAADYDDRRLARARRYLRGLLGHELGHAIQGDGKAFVRLEVYRRIAFPLSVMLAVGMAFSFSGYVALLLGLTFVRYVRKLARHARFTALEARQEAERLADLCSFMCGQAEWTDALLAELASKERLLDGMPIESTASEEHVRRFLERRFHTFHPAWESWPLSAFRKGSELRAHSTAAGRRLNLELLEADADRQAARSHGAA